LHPATQPLVVVRRRGGELYYLTRRATDDLAALHRLRREVVDGPRVIQGAGAPVVYAVCRATHPDGRSVTASATVAFDDPANALMTCETKAKRAATIALLGLELYDDAPTTAVLPGGPTANDNAARPAVAAAPRFDTGPVATAVVDAYFAAVARVARPDDAVDLWLAHRADLAALPPAGRTTVWSALCQRVAACGTSDAAAWLKTAIAARDPRRTSASTSAKVA
jgi:hypothetical protein